MAEPVHNGADKAEQTDDDALRIVRETVTGHERDYSSLGGGFPLSSEGIDPDSFPSREFVIAEHESAYDKQDRLVWKRSRWAREGDERFDEYDALGRLIKRIEKDGQGKVKSVVRWEFDGTSTTPRKIVELGEG